jgi:hypothetical protein
MLKYFKPIPKESLKRMNKEEEEGDQKRIKSSHNENQDPTELPPCPDVELLGLEWSTMRADWLKAFYNEISKDYFLQVCAFHDSHI